MKQHFKQIKLRQSDGSVTYEDVMDVEGAIIVALSLVASGENNARVDALLSWVGNLGRIPTGKEFEEWMAGKGVVLSKMLGKVEDHEN